MSVRTINPPAAPQRLAADFFERLFTSAGLAVGVCDREGHVRAWNPLAERLFGARPRSPERSRHICDVLPEEKHGAFRESLSALLETHEPVEFRARIAGPPGETAEYAVWLTPVCDAAGQLECV